MLTSDLNDLMKLYSMRGVDDWKKNTRAKLRIAVRDRLSNSGIADDERDIRRMICRIFHDGDSRKQFIPMPKCSGSNIDWCFFLPVKIVQKNNEYLRLFLLIKCKGYNWIGFRFEGDRIKFSSWIQPLAIHPKYSRVSRYLRTRLVTG